MDENGFYFVLTHRVPYGNRIYTIPPQEFHDNKFLQPFCEINTTYTRRFEQYDKLEITSDEEERNKGHELLFQFYKWGIIKTAKYHEHKTGKKSIINALEREDETGLIIQSSSSLPSLLARPMNLLMIYLRYLIAILSKVSIKFDFRSVSGIRLEDELGERKKQYLEKFVNYE
jgi:hypothetical protein